MPDPRMIAEQTNRPGFFGRDAEEFVRGQEQEAPRDKNVDANPVNPPAQPAPVANLKEG